MALIRTRRRHGPRFRHGFRSIACGVFFFAAAIPGGAWGQTARVSITGGADFSGKAYSWIVTNEDRSPIVSVEFPHYHGSLFFAPDGWDTACTFLVHVGVADVPGLCTGSVERGDDGIRQKQHRTFRLRMDARGARRGKGHVRVIFQDASEVIVAGVEVPQAEGQVEKYLPLLGLGPMLIVAILVRRKRDRSRAAASSS